MYLNYIKSWIFSDQSYRITIHYNIQHREKFRMNCFDTPLNKRKWWILQVVLVYTTECDTKTRRYCTKQTKTKCLPALQSQLLPDHLVLCRFPSEIVKKKNLTEISNTLISSNSTSRSVLLVSGWDSQVKSLHLFFISNSKYQEHLEIPELRKILSNCCLFPCSLNCTISLCACWPQCLV